MKFLWCDTETTGLKPKNAAPFQIAMIMVSTTKINGEQVKEETERIFYLNPFDIPGIEYSEEAGKVHGYSKEVIETFEPSSVMVKKIDDFLNDMVNFRQHERIFFVGYNGGFDFEHLESLFNHYNLNFNQYFQNQKLDVFEQVKRAGAKGVLPYLPNRKLTTIAEHLKVNLSNAHDAMGDIKATREVAKSLTKMGIPLM